MAFYQSIADLYDHIFPLNPVQISFVKASIPEQEGQEILDVGCGSGSLAIALAPIYKNVIGIDPDESMLALARGKAGTQCSNLQFHIYGMLDLAENFAKESFDAILCFGNTLVHLGSENEILSFLKQSCSLLKPEGKILIQIINYDRIIDKDIKGLPTIENEHIRFVRNYHFHREENELGFETILTDKSDGREIRNNIPLYPIRKYDLEVLLIKAGFTDIRFYGNFKREAFEESSVPLIIEAS